MAVSISISLDTVSTSQTNRTTSVKASVRCKWTGGSYNRTGNASGTLTIGGKIYSFRAKFNEKRTSSGSKTIYTKTVTIKHDSKGKATVSASAKFVTGVSSGTVRASVSKTLGTIAAVSAKKTTTKTTKTNSKQVKITKFEHQNNSDSLFVTWTWSKSNTDHYEVYWYYDTGDGVWFNGSDSDETSKQCTYNPPSNANRVRVKIKPVSKKYKKKVTTKSKSGKKTTTTKEVSYWTAEWAQKDYNIKDGPPSEPSAPSVSIENLVLTAGLDNLDVNANQIKYEIVQDDTKVYKTATVSIVTTSANYSCTVDAGHKYKVRAQAVRNSDKSDWSAYSSEVETQPAAPSAFTSVKTTSSTSIKLTWEAIDTADTYDIEYTTKKDYFDGTDGTSTVSGIETTTYEFTKLETGTEYFFRLRAKNNAGESDWSEISSAVLGKPPVAPTTWSSTNTAIVGEPMTLYWVHNAEDGSDETYAQIEISYGETTMSPITLQNPDAGNDEVEDTTRYLIVHTTDDPEETLPSDAGYNEILLCVPEGTEIEWRVRTAGVTNEFGDWSIQRTVDIYAKPTLTLEITDEEGNSLLDEVTNNIGLTRFPFYIRGLAGPATQVPISYHLSVVANRAYDYVDEIGNVQLISEGDEVYSKYFDTSDELVVELLPGSIDLEGDISYTLTGTVSMNTGLTAESTLTFDVAWEDVYYTPDADVIIDEDAVTAKIRPFCEYEEVIYYKATQNASTGIWTATEEVITDVDDGEPTDDSYTEDDQLVYYGTDSTGTTVYFVIYESGESIPVEGVTLSVYRREFDGGFTEIAKGITNSNTWVVDPHPALDYARYRIVAIDDATGAVGFYDRPNEAVGVSDVIIQWDEEWADFEVSTNPDDAPEDPQWSGSLLRLPYNVDVSDNHSSDVTLVEYIGRKHPVSYYGTQLGETATWNVEVPKEDRETIYALRRLAIYMGDVYVREPYGSGYWASISVSFSQKHTELVVPVTLSITRVEGGM